jgi:hypothetical protein
MSFDNDSEAVLVHFKAPGDYQIMAVLVFHREDTPEHINITDEDGQRIPFGWRCTCCREVFFVSEPKGLSHDCNDNQPVIWSRANISISEGKTCQRN